MGDPLMVALFWVSFLPATIRWQQLVAEEGAESGQLLAWHPWSGERMDLSLSQYADDTTKQIVAKPGGDVQALAKRVQCSNDVFDLERLLMRSKLEVYTLDTLHNTNVPNSVDVHCTMTGLPATAETRRQSTAPEDQELVSKNFLSKLLHPIIGP